MRRRATSTCCCCTTARKDIGGVAERLWYPIWDEGLKLGHAVRTIKEALALAADDLDTATSLLSTSATSPATPALTDELADQGPRRCGSKRAKRWLGRAEPKRARTATTRLGEVAFLLEPDLKEGRGGLRDVHAIRWAEAAAGRDARGRRRRARRAAYDTLLEARVELHRRTGRPGDRLAAAGAGRRGRGPRLRRRRRADARRVVGAPATIAWTSDEVWYRVDSSLTGPSSCAAAPRPSRWPPGVVLRDGRGAPHRGGRPGRRPVAAAARPPWRRPSADARIDRASLDRLAARGAAAARSRGPTRPVHLFADLLLGRAAGDRGDRGARPAGPVGAAPARVGARAQQAAAQRLPPLHRRSAPVRGGGQRRRPRRSGRPARPARGRHAAARHRQGLPRRPHRGRHRAGRRHRRAHGLRGRRHRHAARRWCATTSCCPTWPPGATSTTTTPSGGWPTQVGTCETLRLLARAHRGRLPRHRPGGVERVEGRAGRRAGVPRRPRARRRRGRGHRR